MDVVLPSGVTLKDVPEGLSDDDIRNGAIEQGLATDNDFATPIDREKVVNDWNSFDDEVTQVPTPEKRKEVLKGKLSSLMASGGAEFENAQNNLKEYIKQYTGNENATEETAHGDFNTTVLNVREMSSTENIMDSIIDDMSKDTGVDYGYAKMGGEEVSGLREVKRPAMDVKDAFGNVVFSVPESIDFEDVVYQEQFAKSELEYLTKSDEEQRTIFQEEFVDQTPGGRFILSFGEQIIPEWMMPDIARTQADSPSDVAQELGGSITGVIASFYLAGKVFSVATGGSGVRVAPGVNNMLNKVALKSPRASRVMEQSLNSFALFSARNQIHMDGNLKERIERVGEDAIISTAFPIANQLALIPKVGAPLGVATVGAIGASGKDKDPTERAIGATTMAMVYLLGRGVTYSRAKKDVVEFVKSSGIEANVLNPNGMDAKQWVASINKDGVIKAADNLYNIAQRQRAIADMAKTSLVKTSSGQTPTAGEQLALAKLNESSIVSEARSGDIIPIRGDRAVEQFNTAKKIVQERPIQQEPQQQKVGGEVFTPEGFEGSELQKLNIARTDALRRGDDAEVLRLDEEMRAIQTAQKPDDTSQQIEQSMINDSDDFGIPIEQSIENMGGIPKQPFEQEMHYNDNLPAIIPPKGPTNQDLTTQQGNEWMEEKSKAMRRMTENIFGIFRKFGKQYVSDKPLAEQLEKSYHKIAAQPHLAVLDVHRKLNEYPRTSRQDRTALTVALEADDASGLPNRLLPVYEQLQGIFADAESMQVDAGVLTQTFEEMQNDRIADINRKIKDAKGKEREQLVAERNRLEDIKKYMPHSRVARAVMEEKAANSPVGQRNKFGKKLSQFHKKRKGTHSLKEYLEQGIIDENDMDVVNLAMSAYTDAYHKIAVRSLIEWGKDNGYIMPEGKVVTNPDDWYADDELHPIARVGGMDGMKVNRLFAQGLEELGGKDGSAYNWWDKALAITKVGAFYNPFIIAKHNISQAILGGSAGAKNSAKAFQTVSTKNDLWRQFDEAGLYQKTDIPTRVAVDELIQKMSNKTKDYGGENISKATNILSEFFRTTPEELRGILNDKDVMKALEKAVMGPSMITSGVTWWLDEFQRTNSALNLMDKGYSPEEAAREAARIHVAYSNIGDQYKKVARKILFVHAFRMLMPYELFIRPYIDVADQIYKETTGKGIDSKKLKRAAYVLMATIGLPALYDAWMKLNGYEVAEEERESGMRKLVDKATIKVPLWNGEEMDITPAAFPHWKYSKQIETVDGTKEIVTTIGTPNVILTRMGVRATQQFPQAPGKEKSKQIWNMAKSEINPLYANLFNFFHNEPLSYGEAPPMGIDGQDFVGGVGKYFEQTFQAWSFIIEQFESDMIEDEPEKILKENLNEFEKAMRFYNFMYVRSAPESRKTAMKFQLMEAAKEGANKINRMKLSEEKRGKYMEQWKGLVLESAERIDPKEGDDK